MNTNLLNIVKRIIADYGEAVLADPQRLKAFFSDLAKDEPKPLRIAFDRCIEAGAYAALKTAQDAAERAEHKALVVQKVHDEHGLDRGLCNEALDILEAALSAAAPRKKMCAKCGRELQEEWVSCPFCGTAVRRKKSAMQQQPQSARVPKQSSPREKSSQLPLTLSGHGIGVNSAAYSPDGRRIVSASDDKTVKVWDAETGQLIRTLSGHDGIVSFAAYSPDGRRIVSASSDNTVKVWDAETGRLISTLSGHGSIVSFAAYSPDGRRILSASGDNTVKVWDARD
jgi:hypothetical protein